MARWTENNTEGFTADELEMMNDAQKHLEAKHPDADEGTISDHLNDVFLPGTTFEKLVAGF